MDHRELQKRFADWPEGVGRAPQERTPLKPKLRIKITVHKRVKKLYVIRYLEVVDGGGLKGVWVKG